MGTLTKILWKAALCLVLAGGVSFNLSPNTAHAQFSIQIGISSADAVRTLKRNGYSQIELYRKGLKTANARACKNGIRYDVKVDIKKVIKSAKKIGACRNQVTPAQIQRNLEANGFSRVVIDEQDGFYVAVGCKEGQRLQVVISRQGRTERRNIIGRCNNVLEPSDITQRLRDQGYNRIEFTDSELPRYVAEACLRGRKYELVINRRGEVRNSSRIGRCAAPIRPENLARFLEDNGYSKIEIIDDQLPRYQAEACINNQRVDITLNRFGSVIDRKDLGDCNPPVTKDQIVKILQQEGFTRINVNKANNGSFTIDACLDGNKKRVRLSRTGEYVSEKDVGRCESRSIETIGNRLSKRGYNKLEFYAEACRKGRKYRITFDELGDRVQRERIGRC